MLSSVRKRHPSEAMTIRNQTAQFLGDNHALASIVLNDVQALYGGHTLSVSGSGQVMAAQIKPGGQTTNGSLQLTPAQTAALFQLVIDHDFLTMRISERPGSPDEARPQITLSNTTGQQRTISKWHGVANGRFDPIYTRLLQLVDQAFTP